MMSCVAILYFLALSATAGSAQRKEKWTTLQVIWTPGDLPAFFAQLRFHKMPLTMQAASEVRWAQVASANLTTTWCLQRDPRVCMLYDVQGTVAGMQISLPVADVVFPGNDSVDNHPLLFKNNMYNREWYSARFYLVDQATLAAGGRPPSPLVGTGLWLQSGHDLIEVPRDGDLLAAQVWTRENCFVAMGRHYQYNMSKEMSCEDLQPFFLLLDDYHNSLLGVGFQMIGRPPAQSNKGFDSTPISAIRLMFRNAPRCLEDLAANLGINVLHIYFIERPWGILCQ